MKLQDEYLLPLRLEVVDDFFCFLLPEVLEHFADTFIYEEVVAGRLKFYMIIIGSGRLNHAGECGEIWLRAKNNAETSIIIRANHTLPNATREFTSLVAFPFNAKRNMDITGRDQKTEVMIFERRNQFLHTMVDKILDKIKSSDMAKPIVRPIENLPGRPRLDEKEIIQRITLALYEKHLRCIGKTTRKKIGRKAREHYESPDGIIPNDEKMVSLLKDGNYRYTKAVEFEENDLIEKAEELLETWLDSEQESLNSKVGFIPKS